MANPFEICELVE